MPLISPRHLVGALATFWLAATLPAQRPVYTVGGASPNFTSLPTAIAAVPPGAIVVVRPGVHVGFTTNKPLRVLLDFDAASGVIQPPAGAGYAISLDGVAGADGFVLVGRGAPILPGLIGGIRVVNTSASVVIEGVAVAATSPRSGLEVQNAAAVHVRRSVLAGAPGLQVQIANFSISECVVLSSVGVGAVLYNTRFDAVRTFFSGANQPALRLFDCVGRISSDGSTTISSVAAVGLAVSPLEAWDSDLQFDPARIGLVANGTTPPFVRVGGVFKDEEVPTLVTSQVLPGLPATVRMTSASPRIGAVVLGEMLSTPAVFEFTNVWVNTIAGPVVAAVGICDAAGLVSQTVIPNSPVLRGNVFCLQGVVWQPHGWPVLSGPGLWAVL